MKILIIAVILLAPTLASAFSEITIPPEQRIRLSALSERILLVDITRVELNSPITENGIETQNLVMSGSIVEVVRGPNPGKVFESACLSFRVSDEAAYKNANKGAASPDWFHGESIAVKTGAAEVKQGGRYLVIYCRGSEFFVPVDRADESWRKKLLELRKQEEKPGTEQGGTGQPATRPELKSEGSDKPQPESEGRSR